MKRKVLYVSHNHPAVRPGGAETYALELYQAMRESGRFEPTLLARAGPPHLVRPTVHPGTLLGRVNHDPHQYLFFTNLEDFDWLLLSNRRKQEYHQAYRRFLLGTSPDIVHFQHTLFFGVDIVLATRNALPRAPIVHTLHEYLPICHRNGQMARTDGDELCLEASPRRCHGCFPDIAESSFFLRERFIKSHLARVDQFLAPSRFLLERYVEWGIPRQKIRYEEYGRRPAQPAPDHDRRPRNRIGFFGQLTPFKGLTVLLDAIRILAGREPRLAECPHVSIHGTNIEFFSETFRDNVRRLLAETSAHVTMAGRYEPSQLPQLMADVDWVVVPSIWWENSPLVIQEAFAHGRPVICSDIGAMAEKVTHDVNGLHFRVNDPLSLANTLQYAISSPEIWARLRAGIRQPYPMSEHMTRLEEIYAHLLDERRPS
jgi:glycosyltransferase involved in cell wall biosynthesis